MLFTAAYILILTAAVSHLPGALLQLRDKQPLVYVIHTFIQCEKTNVYMYTYRLCLFIDITHFLMCVCISLYSLYASSCLSLWSFCCCFVRSVSVLFVVVVCFVLFGCHFAFNCGISHLFVDTLHLCCHFASHYMFCFSAAFFTQFPLLKLRERFCICITLWCIYIAFSDLFV